MKPRAIRVRVTARGYKTSTTLSENFANPQTLALFFHGTLATLTSEKSMATNPPTPVVPPKEETKDEEKKRKDVELYEEDDEFEEFVDDDWDESKEDSDQKLWQDDWDDEDVDDDFCRHLREELAKADK